MFSPTHLLRPLTAACLLLCATLSTAQSKTATATLPFDTVFKGRKKFDALVAQADKWKDLPIGQRVAEVGRALTGTPYKSYTLEIDNHIEAPSVNFIGLDCWTFFETSLAFARMLDEPKENWTPQTMLKYIELDRYRGGSCSGYLSRLHYLEDWLRDNERRGLLSDRTRDLGGVSAPHDAVEMTRNWKGYRYMRNNPDLRAGIKSMEARVASEPFYYIPKSQVAAIEPRIQSGDVIAICSHDGRVIGTSHVGLAYRGSDGVLHFMHASAPHNYGKVVVDQRLSDYLYHFRSDAGIMVGRPVK
jgi:hypothetical protein